MSQTTMCDAEGPRGNLIIVDLVVVAAAAAADRINKAVITLSPPRSLSHISLHCAAATLVGAITVMLSFIQVSSISEIWSL